MDRGFRAGRSFGSGERSQRCRGTIAATSPTDTPFGTVSIRFTRDLSEDNDDLRTSAFFRGNYRYWSHSIVGRLLVADRDLGPVTDVDLGEINWGGALRSRVLEQQFPTVGSDYRNDYGELRCGDETCDIVVKRQLLSLR